MERTVVVWRFFLWRFSWRFSWAFSVAVFWLPFFFVAFFFLVGAVFLGVGKRFF